MKRHREPTGAEERKAAAWVKYHGGGHPWNLSGDPPDVARSCEYEYTLDILVFVNARPPRPPGFPKRLQHPRGDRPGDGERTGIA